MGCTVSLQDLGFVRVQWFELKFRFYEAGIQEHFAPYEIHA